MQSHIGVVPGQRLVHHEHCLVGLGIVGNDVYEADAIIRLEV